jgi:hypothetical protein
MAALSLQFSNTGSVDDLHIGTPPDQDNGVFLSRKVKSELDLCSIGVMDTSNPITQSMESASSRNRNLSSEEIPPLPALLNPGIESNAMIALQELGTLVARKKGINTGRFIDGLMQLLSMAEHVMEDTEALKLGNHHSGDTNTEPSENDSAVYQMLTPKHRLRHSRSQPQLDIEQRRRRHFSFEPGDDEIKRLDSDITSYETTQRISPEDVSECDSTDQLPAPTSLGRQLSSDLLKPSRIPSPMQRPALGSIRRKNSLPAVQHADRRTSTSSVLTVFRENANGSVPQGAQRSQTRNGSIAAIAAARAARSSGMIRPENEVPFERSNNHA